MKALPFTNGKKLKNNVGEMWVKLNKTELEGFTFGFTL